MVKEQKSKTGCIIAIAAAVILVLLIAIPVGMYISIYNSLVRQDEAVSAAWGEVENQYQRRAELIPNYVQTVKGAAAHEKDTLQAVVEARAAATQTKIDAGTVMNDPQAFQKFQQAQGALSSALSRLMVVVEKYPNLKANENFMRMQDELAGTENRIAVARKRYNEAARAINTARRGFFGRMVADKLDIKEHSYFESKKGADVAPKVSFE